MKRTNERKCVSSRAGPDGPLLLPPLPLLAPLRLAPPAVNCPLRPEALVLRVPGWAPAPAPVAQRLRGVLREDAVVPVVGEGEAHLVGRPGLALVAGALGL